MAKGGDSPTAAFRLFVKNKSPRTKMILSAQASMFAMLPSEAGVPVINEVPTRAIPHSGLTPTGAEVDTLDEPVRRAGSL